MTEIRCLKNAPTLKRGSTPFRLIPIRLIPSLPPSLPPNPSFPPIRPLPLFSIPLSPEGRRPSPFPSPSPHRGPKARSFRFPFPKGPSSLFPRGSMPAP